MKKILKNKFIGILISTTIGLLIVYFVSWLSGQYKVHVFEHSNWAIGKVVYRTDSGSSVEVEYYVDGVRYIKELKNDGYRNPYGRAFDGTVQL